MATYKVTKVSEQPPRTWDNPKGGTIYYIKVMLEGHDRPVSIGKKSPDAIKVGDTVNGTITADPSHDEDKFKADPVAFGGGGGHNAAPRGTTPEDKESIARSVALKAVVDLRARNKDVSTTDILGEAETFLQWLKGGGNPQLKSDEPHYEQEGF